MFSEIIELSEGELVAWIEQSDSICIKASTEFGDPVELTMNEAKNLSESLLKMIKKIESMED